MKLVTNPGFLVAYTEADENRRERGKDETKKI